MTKINQGRAHISNSLTKVISENVGRCNFSERELRDCWLSEVASDEKMTVNGWYDPPIGGAVILSCSVNDSRRSHFKSFRDPVSFTSERNIDWKDDILIAYASNIDISSGLPADFATTVYFGSDKSTVSYFRSCFKATRECIAGIDSNIDASALFSLLEKGLSKKGIDGRSWSTTDRDYNFGHTLPPILSQDVEPAIIERNLHSSYAHQMRNARRFITASSKWQLNCGQQFTVEPQCVSKSLPNKPKVMIHYVLFADEGGIQICDCCEDLPREIGLI